MKRLLLLLPLFLVPPLLGTAYFLLQAMTGAPSPDPADTVGTGSGNFQAARTAYERANRFLDKARQARPESSTDLLRQAVVQYRVCLAYETATPDGDRLFEEARRSLEASGLLLEQSQRPAPVPPTETAVVQTTPAPAPAVAERQPEAVAAHAAPPSPPPPQPAPAPQLEEALLKKPHPKEPRPQIITVGPDGVPFEIVEMSDPENK